MQAADTILCTINAVTLELQIVEHIGEDVAVVFDNQNSHKGSEK